MRRLSIHRPHSKVRGIQLRLRYLEHWAEQFSTIPLVQGNDRYLNFKIPVLDRLVNPPTTTPEIQKGVLESLIKGAELLSQNKLAQEAPYYRVAVLLVLPAMFHSEITVFFDQKYFESFHYSENLLPDTEAPSVVFDLSLPEGFTETGTLVEWEDTWEDGLDEGTSVTQTYSEKRWTIGQRP